MHACEVHSQWPSLTKKLNDARVEKDLLKKARKKIFAVYFWIFIKIILLLGELFHLTELSLPFLPFNLIYPNNLIFKAGKIVPIFPKFQYIPKCILST